MKTQFNFARSETIFCVTFQLTESELNDIADWDYDKHTNAPPSLIEIGRQLERIQQKYKKEKGV